MAKKRSENVSTIDEVNKIVTPIEETREKIKEKVKQKVKEQTKEITKVRRPRRKWSLTMKIVVALSIVLFVSVATLTATAAVWLNNAYNQVEFTVLDLESLSIDPAVAEMMEEHPILNVAIFGIDAEDEQNGVAVPGGGRSDTIMILSLNQETREIRLVSVFRDTLLEQEDGSINKANTAYFLGGAEEAVAMLNRNFDLNIQHYVSVEYEALVYVVDAIGGITIDIQEDEIFQVNLYSRDIANQLGFERDALEYIQVPGIHLLNGIQATGYSRVRFTYGDDFRRTERQRNVMEQIAKGGQRIGFASLATLIDNVFPMIETNFTLLEMINYGRHAPDLIIGETAGFPFELEPMRFTFWGDALVPVSLAENVTLLHEFLFDIVDYEPSETVIEISDTIVMLTGRGTVVNFTDFNATPPDQHRSPITPPVLTAPERRPNQPAQPPPQQVSPPAQEAPPSEPEPPGEEVPPAEGGGPPTEGGEIPPEEIPPDVSDDGEH